MLFNSLQFFLFFPVVTVLYFLLPHRWRWLLLLLASCVFYMAFVPVYILILFFTIVIDYIAGIMIENAEGRRRKLYLTMSIVANVGVLAVFKYYNFFINNIIEVLTSFHIGVTHLKLLSILLPIGLSFHTFQAMSYTIEVYRGNHKAERHFGIYSLYVMFYPQLVAGPIERPQNMLYQFHERKKLDYKNVSDGLKLVLWGMFKKVVIADRLSLFTDPVFNNPKSYPPLILLMATVFFSFQIFCDFSGYSDIALGTARVMGFKLMTNFNRPYHSRNISEFWKRWHISLSTWFKDYLYISLGGNRVSVPRWYFNLFFVFLVSGFWHGANWTFVVWGALHGFYLVFAIVSEKTRERFNKVTGIVKVKWLYNSIQVLTTFCLVAVAWIFFRANTLRDAFYMAGRLPVAVKDIFKMAVNRHFTFGKLPPMKIQDVVLSVVFIVVLEVVHLLQGHDNIEAMLSKRPAYVRWTVYYLFAFCILSFGIFEHRYFIYFQF